MSNRWLGARGRLTAALTVDGVALDAVVGPGAERPFVGHEVIVTDIRIEKLTRAVGRVVHAPDCNRCKPVSAYDAVCRAAKAAALVARARGVTVVGAGAEVTSAPEGARRTALRVHGERLELVEQVVRTREWSSGSDDWGRSRVGSDRAWETVRSWPATPADFEDPVVSAAVARWIKAVAADPVVSAAIARLTKAVATK